MVGIDGSETSIRALRWAAAFAGMLDSQVYAVCVVPFEPYAQRPRLADVDSADPVGETLSNLRALTDDIAGEMGVNIVGDVLIGDPTSQLVESADSGELLVLGAVGHRGSASNALGSTSRGCVTHSAGPTVVVR
jgi:nucleotide-binding universal stress UspA family protein